MDPQTLLRNRQRQSRAADLAVRLVYADVVDDSPLTVSYDDGETSQAAVKPTHVTVTAGDRVAVFKSGNAPGYIDGVIT